MDRVFSFLLWPKCKARGPWKQGRKKRGSITCRTDWANEANKMFIIWLCWLFRFWKADRKLEVRRATYGPGIDQSQHANSVSHIIMYRIVSFIYVPFNYFYYKILCDPLICDNVFYNKMMAKRLHPLLKKTPNDSIYRPKDTKKTPPIIQMANTYQWTINITIIHVKIRQKIFRVD